MTEMLGSIAGNMFDRSYPLCSILFLETCWTGVIPFVGDCLIFYMKKTNLLPLLLIVFTGAPLVTALLNHYGPSGRMPLVPDFTTSLLNHYGPSGGMPLVPDFTTSLFGLIWLNA